MTGNPVATQQWVEFENDSGETVPAFGVVKITGLTLPEAGRVVLVGDKPDAFGAQYNHYINGAVSVADGKRGLCVRSDLIVAVYDPAEGDPVFGEMWGPRSGSWKLNKDTGGFRVLDVTNSDKHLVLVSPAPLLSFIGVAAETILDGTEGDVYVGESSLPVRVIAAFGTIPLAATVWSSFDLISGSFYGIQIPCAAATTTTTTTAPP